MSDVRGIQFRALQDFLRWLGGGSDGAQVLERPGVTGAIVPVSPQRSLVNSVAYENAAALTAAYEELASAYEAAGIFAWTVWTPEDDHAAIDLLVRNGHAFDGKPQAMTLDLGHVREAPLGDLDWDMRAGFDELGEINDLAYGISGDGIAPAISDAPGHLSLRIYRARSGGEVASVLATMDHGDDLGIYFVATNDGHRGKGLCARLLTQALIEARDRGLHTSSLQSSALGVPVYERLGYESHFGLHLYERRRASG